MPTKVTKKSKVGLAWNGRRRCPPGSFTGLGETRDLFRTLGSQRRETRRPLFTRSSALARPPGLTA